MPGIGGFVSKSGITHLPAIIQKFEETMCWSQNYHILKYRNPQNSLCLIATTNKIVDISKLIDDNRYKSVMFGEIYPVASDQQSIVNKKHKDLVEGYFNYGMEYFYSIDGTFLLAIWDENNKELVIVNDMFGTYPLNYFHDGENLIFSSQIKAIMHFINSPELNELAVAENLALGITLNGKTFVKKIERLWPGSALKYKNGNLKIHKYFNPTYNYSKNKINLKKRLHNISEAFNNAVRKRIYTNENLAIALSGGFDTRAIWSSIFNDNQNYQAVTLGERNCADIEVASTICNSLKLKHKIYHILEDFWENFDYWVNRLIKMSEGFINIESSFLIPYYEYLGNEFNTLIDGPGGAFYRRQAFHRYRDKEINHLQKYLYNVHLNTHFIDGTVDEDFRKTYEKSIQEDLTEYIYEYRNNGEGEDIVDLFYLHQYVGLRYSSDALLQTHFINCRQPFYDNDTFKQVRNFSPIERRKLYIHKFIINNFQPKLEKYPLVSSGFKIPYKGFRWKRTIPLGLNLLLNKLNSKIQINSLQNSLVVNFKRVYGEFLQSYLTNLINESDLKSLWDRDKLRNKLILHRKNIVDHSSTFSNFITTELTIKELFKQ